MAHNNTISVLKDQMQEMAANIEAEFQRLLHNLINKLVVPVSEGSVESSLMGGEHTILKALPKSLDGAEMNRVKYTDDIDPYIVKKIELINETDIPLQVLREMHVWSSLEHPNIVRLQRVRTQGKYMFLVLEDVGDRLTTHLENKTTDLLLKTKDVLRGILSGIQYCHSHGIIHRNLNPDNILISFAEKEGEEDEIKLMDFGSAIFVADDPYQYTGNDEYIAPEIHMGVDKHTDRVDMWSFGCIFAKLLDDKKVLFGGQCKTEVLEKIFSTMGLPTEDSWPGVSLLPFFPHGIERSPPMDLSEIFPKTDLVGLDLLKRCLSLNPNARISADEALAHPFLS